MSDLVIMGASTRAAATSARRAGWKPWCVDLFADADLERIATVRKVPAEVYPDGLLDALKDAPPGPILYTGALENRPELIAKLERPLLGNSAEVLRAIRTPERWVECLRERGLACPALAVKPVSKGNWLIKPRKSAGGAGIREFAGQTFSPRTHFLQEWIDGVPCAAIFRASENGAIYFGMTKQLIGAPWLNASGFHYAGNIGPLVVADAERIWIEIGAALTETFHLRGLFGVDAVLRDGVPWPVEINPRYTASVEILERYRRHGLFTAPEGDAPETGRVDRVNKGEGTLWGKAILFARTTFAFPADGPWLDALKDNADLDETEFADIPHAGEVIERGQPVLTLFASAASLPECETKLQEKARALDRRLWG